VTGLSQELSLQSAPRASKEDLLRVHPKAYLDAFKALSDTGGGELGRNTPFGQGGFEHAALSTGLVKGALFSVLKGTLNNAYALSRPPGHHCLPDYANGFCLLANIAVAVEAALAEHLTERVAVLDWDVHHGNGTEAIFYDRADVLTVSLHQERNYPMDTGDFAQRGEGAGAGANLNIPLPPGTGHAGYIEAMERLALPVIRGFKPDVIVVACGFDAAAIDPLSRMLATAETFSTMTRQVRALAGDICDGRLTMAHEGGYSEVYVPFCGHAVLQQMSGSAIHADDPLGPTFAARQPGPALSRFISDQIGEMVEAINLS
jgi:acetoin utilization deacetylase AcuC-like enzyme